MLYGICFWLLNKDKENILFYDKREEFENLIHKRKYLLS